MSGAALCLNEVGEGTGFGKSVDFIDFAAQFRRAGYALEVVEQVSVQRGAHELVRRQYVVFGEIAREQSL